MNEFALQHHYKVPARMRHRILPISEARHLGDARPGGG